MGGTHLKTKDSDTKAVIITIVICCSVMVLMAFGVTACDRDASNYDRGKEFFNSGRYDEAYAIFEKLGDYEDSGRFLLVIDILLRPGSNSHSIEERYNHNRDSFLALYALNDLTESRRHTFNFAERMFQDSNSASSEVIWLEEVKDAYLRIKEWGEYYISDKAAERIEEIDAVFMRRIESERQTEEIAEEIQRIENLYIYWAEEVDRGNNPIRLANNPLDYEIFATDGIDNLYAAWQGRRIDSMKAIVEGWNIYDFFQSNDPSTGASATITGNGLWFLNNDSFMYLFPVFFIADKPENARYLLYHASSTTSFYGNYTDGKSGYSETAEIVLEDRVTGEIIFQEVYTANPPEVKSHDNDVYAHVTGLGDFRADISRVVEALLNAWD